MTRGGPSRWLARIKRFDFPQRASTQTWMFLTFALFVGLAVTVISIYVLFNLGTQVRQAAQATHLARTQQMASLLQTADSDDERTELLQSLQHVSGQVVLIMRADTLVAASDSAGFVPVDSLLRSFDTSQVSSSAPHYAVHVRGDAQRFALGAVARQGLIIVLASPESPLQVLTRGMRNRSIYGLLMVLFMALLGSWIASDRVSRPLRRISRSAKDIAAGKFDTPIRVSTRAAEIQDLARNLDRMSEGYRDKIEELEKLARLQGEFIGNIGHEVRNPLFSITGYLEELGRDDLAAARREYYASRGLTNLGRLQSLFNRLIAIAKLEYREDAINRVSFDIGDVARQVRESLLPQAQERNLDIEVIAESVRVSADRELIRQVLANLMENALAYSERGVVRCHVRARKDRVCIEVADQGCGIAEQHLNRVFERFYRVDPARARESGGAGLGLPIVKQVLQSHGETIHLESTLGEGSRFWFELPRADQYAT